MRDRWSTEEINYILEQLDKQGYPFAGYTYRRDGKGAFVSLGRGGYGRIYEAARRKDFASACAIKIIGFDGGCVDSEVFKAQILDQRMLASLEKNVVKIYDSSELFIFVDETDRILSVEKARRELKTGEAGCLRLQFIRMEKLKPVLQKDENGMWKLYPDALRENAAGEVEKLAYEISTALRRVHLSQLLHRDVKLENIFYDPIKKCYKLGDFGIASVTTDGLAKTTIYTKGYGAPEVVGQLYEKYDHTADIYSLGIVLFVLTNDLHFPDSETYDSNINKQYASGYVIPKPAHCTEGLYQIIRKMCMYNPDDRYQEIEEVLYALDALQMSEGEEIKDRDVYRRRHANGAGMVWFACLIVDVGAFLLIGWEIMWLHLLLLSLAFFIYLEFILLTAKQKKIREIRKKRKWQYIVPYFFYGLMLLFGQQLKTNEYTSLFFEMFCEFPLAKYTPLPYINADEFMKLGILGAVIITAWFLREKILAFAYEVEKEDTEASVDD